MQAIGIVGFLLVGLAQLAALFSFFSDYWHWNWLISGIAAFFLSYCPVVGGIAGAYAAVKVWHWDWWWGALLFFWPLIFIIPQMLMDRDR